MTDVRSTAVVKEALSDGATPVPSATAVVKVALVDGDAPKPCASAIVKMVWANVQNADDCCCSLTFPSMMMVRP